MKTRRKKGTGCLVKIGNVWYGRIMTKGKVKVVRIGIYDSPPYEKWDEWLGKHFKQPPVIHNKRIRRIWYGMSSRCYNSKCSEYQYYGGRGIQVCDEWRNSYEAFESWAMENGYSDNLTIDRIDNNGNYCPDNCRWATYKQQANNRRNTMFIEVNGTSMSVREFSDILKLSRTQEECLRDYLTTATIALSNEVISG